MSVNSAPLVQAMKELNAEWQQTKYHWNDVKSREFEEKYLQELPAQVAQAASVIEEINLLLRKARTDCE